MNLRTVSLLIIGLGLRALTVSAVAASSAAASLPAKFLWSTSTGEHAPAIVPFLPDATSATGAGILIVPANDASARDPEGDGAQLARWLTQRGVAAFVLRRPAAGIDSPSLDASVRRALRVIRADAAEYRISPQRLALVGIGAGADAAANAACAPLSLTAAPAAPADAVDRLSDRPDLLALIWGGATPETPAEFPPTFLVGSAAVRDGMSGQLELWNKLRAARVPVDAHFFARAEANAGQPGNHPSLGAWPEIFFTWIRFQGLLTSEPRVPLKGMVFLDGRVLPQGYVILTPVDFVGAGPIVARVLNSTANVPIGQFTVPAGQGPIAGRYKVDVRQNMARWLSNSFSGGLVVTRGAPPTPEQVHFGHHRVLAPSLADQRSFTKVRPTDASDYIIEIKPDAAANLDLRIEVFSGAPLVGVTPAPDSAAQKDIGGIIGGPKNPGQAAYVEQLQHSPVGPVAGIPEPILLWPNGAPEAVPDANGVFTDEDKPALYPFPAAAANNTGAAFLIIPGGAFTNRVMDAEGVQVARFLNRHGISGFVLRYRVGPNYPRRTISTMDGHRAMRYIRAHAAEFGIAPDRIGTIGFSAGAELQGDAFYNSALEGDPNAIDPLERVSTRANFCALIYGGRNLQRAADAPPTFLFNTIEDAGHLGVQVSVLNSLRQAAVPVEAHFYHAGPHGTAMSPGDPQLGQWPELMVKWLAGSRVIRPANRITGKN